MLRGGSILYAIFICLLITGISSCFVLFSFHQRSIEQKRSNYLSVLFKLKSAITLATSEELRLEANKARGIQLFKDDARSEVRLVSSDWGLFKLIRASAAFEGKTISKHALLGSSSLQNSDLCLYLADRNQSLSLAGNTVIQGRALLPRAGIKRAYIEGQSFNGQLPTSSGSNSSKNLPLLNPNLDPQQQSLISGFFDNDSVLGADMLYGEAFYQPWSSKTVVYASDGRIDLSNMSLGGNLILYSRTSIDVSHCNLAGVQLIAPLISIRNNTFGQAHLLATDSIIIKNEVNLTYPSSMCLNAPATVIKPGLLIVNSSVEGDIVIHGDAKHYRNPARMSIDKKSSVTGVVYVQGQLELEGAVYGQVYTEGFSLNTASAKYSNHLLNARISRLGLPTNYLSSLALDDSNKKILQWLD
ncbi:MAG: hypothetical protein RIE58_07770 [Vicingaceae bacterium]